MIDEKMLAEFERMIESTPVKFEHPRKARLKAEIERLEKLVVVYSNTDWLACEATIVKIKALDNELLDLMTEEVAA